MKHQNILVGDSQDHAEMSLGFQIRGASSSIVVGILCPLEIGLMPGICVKYFLSFPHRNLTPQKTETN